MKVSRVPFGRRTLVFEPRRAARTVAMVTAVALVAGLVSVPPAVADPPNSHRPKVADHERTVDGRALKARPRKVGPVEPGPAARAAWPKPGAAEVGVPSGTGPALSALNGPRGGVRAGGLPVTVLAPSGDRVAGAVPVAERVRVRVLDRREARGLGVDGLAFTVARTDAAEAGRVRLRLDYSTFAQAFGGAYGPRLRLTRVPSCALTTPGDPKCRTGVPVKAVNDGATGTLTADVEAVPEGAGQDATVLVAAAGSDSSQGDYGASSLEASATWQGGGNGGDFTWSYPVRVPPVPGKLTPQVAVSYSSGSVDGRTSNTNGQPSWVGEGFDLWPGYIERRYKSCEEDGAPKDAGGNYPADQCWGYDNATVTWGGKGGELIKDADGIWRMKDDDGTRFEKLAGSSTGNGDKFGEYWKVTTTDGIQYFFGLNRLPGWTEGKPQTGSTWTMPVFGDDATEPCHESTFAESWCQRAYRWNLDYVVDPAGNAVNYTYGQEINHYGRNLKAADETPYVRGGYLKTISYGLRADALFAKPPAQVTFATSERCIPDATFDCDPSKIGEKPDYWWDVPWDLHCDSGQECKDTHGGLTPTFWSRKRLTGITTQILKSDGSGYRPVDSWSLNHSWGLADVERDLLLRDIQHTGHAANGATTTLPKVRFNPVQLPNRPDRSGDDVLSYIRYRVGAIYDESGGQLDIDYSDPDPACSASDKPTPETNTSRCMPVIWTPPGEEDPTTGWFHKYVVTSVIQTDRTGLSPDMATKYEYLGGAAWHFDDDDGLTKDKNKTWSQWRGYGHVRTLTGAYDAPSTQSDTYYLRGMDGDRKTKDGGTKSVTVSDGEGGTYPDHDALSGFTLKTVQYTGPGGSVHSKTVNTPWRVQTASRTRSWGTTTANVTATDTSRTWTVKDGGGWTETKTDNTFETSGAGIGRVTAVSDLGDVSTPSDDTCARTSYADNTGTGMVKFPSRLETVSVACAVTPERPAHVLSDVRTYYDNAAFGAAPSKGRVTKVEKLADYDGATPRYVTQAATVYDEYGRTTKVTDAVGNPATTAYTDTQGLNTQVTTTSPPATPGNSSTTLTTVQDIEPAWGVPVRTVDQSNLNLRTDLVYDPLGRLTQVWLPNRSKANNPYPNHEYAYKVVDGQIVAVTTKGLTAGGGQRVEKIELLDGWLRPRQTQTPGQTGRLITDTFHDDRGQVVKTYAPYAAAGAPDTALFGVGTPGNIESQTRTEYDGLGRRTVEKLTQGNGSQPDQELWRTTYAYGGGNRVSITPPAGATPTATLTDAQGKVIERRQYKASTTTGEYDTTTYTYTPAGLPATVTDPSGNTFTTTYDLRGRKVTTTDPDKGTTTLTYDDLDRVTSTTDGRGKKIFTDYDGHGRKTATHQGTTDGPVLTSWTYDTVIRGKGKLATATRHTPDGDYVSTVRNYDTLGRADGTALTIPDSQGPLAGRYLFSTRYSLDGTVQGQARPAGGGLLAESVNYTYDDLLRPLTLTGADTSPIDQTTYVNDVDYTPTGKPQLLELGPAGKHTWQTFTYQYGTQRPATARSLREGVQGDDRYATYHYTDAGTITSINDVSRDGIDNQCFTYDYLQRVTQAWTQTTGTCATQPTAPVIGGPSPYWQSFTYDTAGNRTGETRHGLGGVADTVRTYAYAAPGQGNRLTQVTQTGPTGDRTDTYAYDAIGNTTNRAIDAGANPGQTLEWDTEGELAKVTENGNDVTFVYDTDGNRLIRKDPAGATLYLPDGTELRALNGAATATGTRYYTFAGQTVAMRTSEGNITYLTGDHQGTAQIAVNATTLQSTVRRSTPFGAIRGMDDDATWPDDKGFLGATKDPTGLTHLSAREYDPETGRFISVDPLLDESNPQQMNGYTYASNSPITYSDPSGLRTDGCEVNHDCSKTPRNARKGSVRCHSYCGPVTPRGGAKRGGDHLAAPVLGHALPRKTYLHLLNLGYRGSQDFTLRDAIAYLGAGLDDNEWDGFCRTINASAQSQCHINPFTGHDTTDSGLKPALIAGGVAAVVIAGVALCAAGGCESGAFEAAGLACARSGACRGAISAAMSAGGALNSGYGAGEAPTGAMGRAGSWLSRLGCRSSFVPGTKVLMADGTKKNIEDLRVGDKVLATDPETGETKPEPVLGTITSKGDKNLVQITIDTNAPLRFKVTGDEPKPRVTELRVLQSPKSGVVIATDNHPFWVAGDISAWVKATDLEPGMWLRTSAGTYVQITATEHWTTRNQRVHNLTIANLHTYHALAGQTPLLVHNTDPCDPAPLKSLHPASSLDKSSLSYWHRQDTTDIVASLRPGAHEPLLVKPDGTIMNGNTRIAVLRSRGYDVNSLPRESYGSGRPMTDDDFWNMDQ